MSSAQVYTNPWMTVREDVVRRQDGSTGRYAVVDGPDLTLVVPTDADRLHLVEQYRHALSGRRWEFPAGNAEPGVDSDETAAAARELREETGLSAATLTRLGTFDVAPGLSSQRCAVFLATELTPGSPDRDLAEQDMRSAWFTRTEVEEMIADGTITDAKTLAAYALVLLRRPAPDAWPRLAPTTGDRNRLSRGEASELCRQMGKARHQSCGVVDRVLAPSTA